jgi:hypothetical protein
MWAQSPLNTLRIQRTLLWPLIVFRPFLYSRVHITMKAMVSVHWTFQNRVRVTPSFVHVKLDRNGSAFQLPHKIDRSIRWYRLVTTAMVNSDRWQVLSQCSIVGYTFLDYHVGIIGISLTPKYSVHQCLIQAVFDKGLLHGR